jgi:hypothetical protein
MRTSGFPSNSITGTSPSDPDWELKVTPVFNFNYVIRENNLVNINGKGDNGQTTISLSRNCRLKNICSM